VRLFSNLDHEKRLVDVPNSFVVDVLEVLSQVDHRAVVRKSVLDRAQIEINVLHEVAP
jgi:protoheme ferro-lyase